MSQTYSQLVYRQIQPATNASQGGRTVVTLHGHNGGLDDMVPLARSLGDNNTIIAPEAARSVYQSINVTGRTWFGGTPERPEPASFGDSLAQLERFLYDVRGRDETHHHPWLLGYEQGATMALSLAVIVPEVLGGVIAICGGLPTFSDPTLLDPVAGDLPILLIGETTRRDADGTWMERTQRHLERVDRLVTSIWIHNARRLGPPVQEEIRGWLDRLDQPR